MDRRTAVGVSAAALAGSVKSAAATTTSHSFPGDVEPRGTVGRLERLPSLDLESRQDFLTSFRKLTDRALNAACATRTNELFKAKGIDPNSDPDIKTIIDIVKDDPLIQTSVRTWVSCQQMTWQDLFDYYRSKPDVFLAELERADRAGPGTMELNPGLNIPDYAKHEIHIQPGGYVGDEFTGHVYHYGTNNFYKGGNDQDEVQIKLAASVPPPRDGKVMRILEMGCSTGQMTVALKQRFPNAEVWGIDVGGPLIRYAHMRGADLGVDVNFAQRLAEDTKFPAGHFDIVTNYILFHEVPATVANQIVREAHRILRPGGVFFPIDFYTGGNKVSKNAYAKFRHYWDHRWNNEVWWNEYENLDMPATMRQAGFDVDMNGPAAWLGTTNILGTKLA